MIEPLPKLLEKLYDSDSLIYNTDNEFFYNKDFDKELLEDIERHNFQIYSGTYSYKEGWKTPKLYFMGRGKNCGKKIFKVEGFPPYCYVDSPKGSYKTIHGNRVEKVIFETEPRRVADLRKYRERIGTLVPYEADILYVRRFLLDTYDFFKPDRYIMPKVCIMDIETNFPVNSNLLSFAINGYDGKLYYNSIYDEPNKFALALDAYVRLTEYDVVTNWNVEFDVKGLRIKLEPIGIALQPIDDGYTVSKHTYISMLTTEYNMFSINAAKNMVDALLEYDFLKEEDGVIKRGSRKLNTDIEFLMSPIDLMIISKKMYGREIPGRWSLDNTGIQMCGVSKYDYGYRYPRDATPEDLMEYNVMDVIIPEIIDNMLGAVECHIILGWSLQSKLEDMIMTAVVNDISLLREYHKDKIVLPSRPPYKRNKTGEEETYKAAEPDARPGVYENVVAYDLHAAYPSAVLAVNASIESKDEKGKFRAPNGIRFNNKYSTFIKALKDLLNDREHIKGKLKDLDKTSAKWRTYKYIDFALKTEVAALSHGMFGWGSSRTKDLEVADSITATVRGILDTIKNYVDKKGFPWVYCHTDSVYVNMPKEDAEWLLVELNVIIDKYCEEQGYSHIPHLDYKGFYPKAYIHSPARNVLIDENGEWESTGMNYYRSEVPQPLADVEKTMIAMRIDGKTDDELFEKLKNMIDNLKNEDTRELGIIKPLSKSLKKYGRKNKAGKIGGIPYHISALLRAKDEYDFMVKVGEKFCVLPILVDEWEGVRVKRRKKVFMAYDIDEGLPDIYEIDWTQYLRSNLFGKICKLFDMKPKELESKIYVECN